MILILNVVMLSYLCLEHKLWVAGFWEGLGNVILDYPQGAVESWQTREATSDDAFLLCTSSSYFLINLVVIFNDFSF